MTFTECVMVCAGQTGLVREFDRLSGHNLSGRKPRSGIEVMIDEATGYGKAREDEACVDFLNFVWECVWTRIDLREVDQKHATTEKI